MSISACAASCTVQVADSMSASFAPLHLCENVNWTKHNQGFSDDTLGNAFFARTMHTEWRPQWRRLLLITSDFQARGAEVDVGERDERMRANRHQSTQRIDSLP